MDFKRYMDDDDLFGAGTSPYVFPLLKLFKNLLNVVTKYATAL